MAMTFPVGPTISASSRVCPPPPRVPSTTVIPVVRFRNDSDSFTRTLVWRLVEECRWIEFELCTSPV